MAKLAVFITTHERPHLLIRLLRQLDWYQRHYEIHVIISEDKSDADYSRCHALLEQNFRSYHWLTSPRHYGKKNYHKILNAGLSVLKGYHDIYDYFFKIDDDQLLEPGFFERSIEAWQRLMDPRKIGLTLINHDRKICWTKYRRTPHHSAGIKYYRTQWVDGAFMGTSRFWLCLRYHVFETPREWWEPDESRGSGSYRDISLRLDGMRLHIYCLASSLIFHGNHPSKMNPKESPHQSTISHYE